MTYQIRARNPHNKHNAVSTVFMGERYHSKGEAEYAASLQAEKLAGEIQSYDRQVKIDLRVNGQHITNYWMDFVVQVDDHTVELREYKGMETPVWKMKWAILEATLDEVRDRMWPEKEVKMVLVKHKSAWKPRKGKR